MTALDDLHALWAELAQTTKGYTRMPQPLPAGHWLNAKGIYDALERQLATPAPPPPPPPDPVPVPPPPPSGVWAWDASRATVRADSAAAGAGVRATAKSYAMMAASVAIVDAGAAPLQTVVVGGVSYHVAIPAGTIGGHSTDGHLAVTDVGRGVETDFWKYQPGSASAIAPLPLGAPSETRPGNANAARFPLRRGVINPADVANNVLHPLVFSVAKPLIAPGKGVYPADTDYGGTATAAAAPFGGWFRLPAMVFDGGLDKLSLYVCRCLVQHGMFLRDSGEQFTIYGLDAVNQGGSQQAWQAAGVPLTQSVPGLWFTRLSALIPWDRLQLLEAPAR